MRQTLSMRDQQLANTLLSSNKALNHNDEYKALRMALLGHGLDVESAFILNWIPEQGEDIYTILADNSKIAIVELARNELKEVMDFDVLAIEDYKQKFPLSKTARQKLTMAINLQAHSQHRLG
jgi:hypothetical protein